MFGIGPQELLIVGALVLLVFGPHGAAGMARELGRLVSGANRTFEEIKSELVPEKEIGDAKRAVEEVRAEIVSTGHEGGEGSSREKPSPREL